MADLASFVKDAPAGELEAIRKDISVFTSGNKAVNDKVVAAIAQYNIENLRRVQVDDKVTVLSKYNRLGDNEFFTGDVEFTVDHVSGKASTESGSSRSASSESKQVYAALETYITAHYGEDTVFDVFDSDNGIAVCISGRKLSPRNFFNGQWIGQYELQNGKLSGDIKVDVHYFEDGNVRLKTGTAVSASASAAKLVDAIAKAEEEFEVSLNATLVKINENEFKALRRQLPVTRSYMEWDQVATYKVGREIEKR